MWCPVIQNFQLEYTAHMKIFLISSYQWMVRYSSCFAEFFPQICSLLITPCCLSAPIKLLNQYNDFHTEIHTTNIPLDAITLPGISLFQHQIIRTWWTSQFVKWEWHTTYFRALKWCTVKRLQEKILFLLHITTWQACKHFI